jgi:hypothetical protein
MPSKEIVGCWSPALFPSCSWPSEVSSLHHALPATMYCHATGPKAMEPTDHGLKPPNLWAKVNLSFFKVDYLRYFVTIAETDWHRNLCRHTQPTTDVSSCIFHLCTNFEHTTWSLEFTSVSEITCSARMFFPVLSKGNHCSELSTAWRVINLLLSCLLLPS